MRCKSFNFNESIRLKSNNKISKIKLTLMLFLVGLLDGVYSKKMDTLKPAKALTKRDLKKIILSNRFLDNLFGISNLVDINVNSPHDIVHSDSRKHYPSVEKPVYLKPRIEGHCNEKPTYSKPNNDKPNDSKPNNDKPNDSKRKKVRPHTDRPNNVHYNWRPF